MYLVVHPPSSCDGCDTSDAGVTTRAMQVSAAPDEGMTMGVPVPGRGRNGCADLVPRLEALPLERQRAQDLPPRFDQIQVRGVFGLEDELPAGMRQGEEQDIGGAAGAAVVQNGVDQPYVRS